jgi:predicted nucleotidyltransferase
VASVIDKSARMRLAAALDREGVVAALLHGSQATGKATALSDVDVAVWLDPSLSDDARLDLRLALTREIDSRQVDLVILNDASPLLAHRVRQSGIQLVDRDPVARIRLETQALIEYLDTKPLREELARGTRDRLTEDRFGRQ